MKIFHSIKRIITSISTRLYHSGVKPSTMATGRIIDVRSDTVTQPSPAMLQAMITAPLGDDVFKEDPTVNELEKKVAQLLGKEAALFVPSGTMGNLIAVMAHCDSRGMEVILGDRSHIFFYEQGGVAQLGGIQPNPLKTNPDGTFELSEVVQKIRSDKLHEPRSGLICIENTHNKCGGTVLPLDYLNQLGALKKQLGLPLHLDGARLFNAAVYLKVPAKTLTEHCDSVSICISKSLGAPIGSVLAGSNNFISKAIRLRKVMGGGMRQAGILAAAGIYALDNMVDRLEEDHKHTRLIAEAIHNANSKAVSVNLETLQTNILLIILQPSIIGSRRFCERMGMIRKSEQEFLKEDAVIIKIYPFEPYVARLVMHAGVNHNDVLSMIKKFIYVINEIDNQ